MAWRFHLGKPIHPYKHMPKWATADSEKMIQNLHQIEKQLRKEIRDTQVKVYTKAEILALYPDWRA